MAKNTEMKNFFYIERNFEQNWNSDERMNSNIAFVERICKYSESYILCWS